jgi:hypothetical protein
MKLIIFVFVLTIVKSSRFGWPFPKISEEIEAFDSEIKKIEENEQQFHKQIKGFKDDIIVGLVNCEYYRSKLRNLVGEEEFLKFHDEKSNSKFHNIDCRDPLPKINAFQEEKLKIAVTPKPKGFFIPFVSTEDKKKEYYDKLSSWENCKKVHQLTREERDKLHWSARGYWEEFLKKIK